jgi:hypothetical protein
MSQYTPAQIAQQNIVFQQALAQGRITQAQYNQAMQAQPHPTSPMPTEYWSKPTPTSTPTNQIGNYTLTPTTHPIQNTPNTPYNPAQAAQDIQQYNPTLTLSLPPGAVPVSYNKETQTAQYLSASQYKEYEASRDFYWKAGYPEYAGKYNAPQNIAPTQVKTITENKNIFVGPVKDEASRPIESSLEFTLKPNPRVEQAINRSNLQESFLSGTNTRQGTASPGGVTMNQITQGLTPEEKTEFNTYQEQKLRTNQLNLGLFIVASAVAPAVGPVTALSGLAAGALISQGMKTATIVYNGGDWKGNWKQSALTSEEIYQSATTGVIFAGIGKAVPEVLTRFGGQIGTKIAGYTIAKGGERVGQTVFKAGQKIPMIYSSGQQAVGAMVGRTGAQTLAGTGVGSSLELAQTGQVTQEGLAQNIIFNSLFAGAGEFGGAVRSYLPHFLGGGVKAVKPVVLKNRPEITLVNPTKNGEIQSTRITEFGTQEVLVSRNTAKKAAIQLQSNEGVIIEFVGKEKVTEFIAPSRKTETLVSKVNSQGIPVTSVEHFGAGEVTTFGKVEPKGLSQDWQVDVQGNKPKVFSGRHNLVSLQSIDARFQQRGETLFITPELQAQQKYMTDLGYAKTDIILSPDIRRNNGSYNPSTNEIFLSTKTNPVLNEVIASHEFGHVTQTSSSHRNAKPYNPYENDLRKERLNEDIDYETFRYHYEADAWDIARTLPKSQEAKNVFSTDRDMSLPSYLGRGREAAHLVSSEEAIYSAKDLTSIIDPTVPAPEIMGIAQRYESVSSIPEETGQKLSQEQTIWGRKNLQGPSVAERLSGIGERARNLLGLNTVSSQTDVITADLGSLRKQTSHNNGAPFSETRNAEPFLAITQNKHFTTKTVDTLSNRKTIQVGGANVKTAQEVFRNNFGIYEKEAPIIIPERSFNNAVVLTKTRIASVKELGTVNPKIIERSITEIKIKVKVPKEDITSLLSQVQGEAVKTDSFELPTKDILRLESGKSLSSEDIIQMKLAEAENRYITGLEAPTYIRGVSKPSSMKKPLEGVPKIDKEGNVFKDASGKIIYEGYSRGSQTEVLMKQTGKPVLKENILTDVEGNLLKVDMTAEGKVGSLNKQPYNLSSMNANVAQQKEKQKAQTKSAEKYGVEYGNTGGKAVNPFNKQTRQTNEITEEYQEYIYNTIPNNVLSTPIQINHILTTPIQINHPLTEQTTTQRSRQAQTNVPHFNTNITPRFKQTQEATPIFTIIQTKEKQQTPSNTESFYNLKTKNTTNQREKIRSDVVQKQFIGPTKYQEQKPNQEILQTTPQRQREITQPSTTTDMFFDTPTKTYTLPAFSDSKFESKGFPSFGSGKKVGVRSYRREYPILTGEELLGF